MIELVQIPKENTDTVWHLCKGMIANALARSNGYASETHFKNIDFICIEVHPIIQCMV